MGPWAFIGFVVFSLYAYTLYSDCPDKQPDPDVNPNPNPDKERKPLNFQGRQMYLNLKGSNVTEHQSVPNADELWSKDDPTFEKSMNDDPDTGIEGKTMDAVRPDTLKFARQTVGEYVSYYDLDPITREPHGPSQITLQRAGFKDARTVIQVRDSNIVKTFPGVKTDRVLQA